MGNLISCCRPEVSKRDKVYGLHPGYHASSSTRELASNPAYCDAPRECEEDVDDRCPLPERAFGAASSRSQRRTMPSAAVGDAQDGRPRQSATTVARQPNATADTVSEVPTNPHQGDDEPSSELQAATSGGTEHQQVRASDTSSLEERLMAKLRASAERQEQQMQQLVTEIARVAAETTQRNQQFDQQLRDAQGTLADLKAKLEQQETGQAAAAPDLGRQITELQAAVQQLLLQQQQSHPLQFPQSRPGPQPQPRSPLHQVQEPEGPQLEQVQEPEGPQLEQGQEPEGPQLEQGQEPEGPPPRPQQLAELQLRRKNTGDPFIAYRVVVRDKQVFEIKRVPGINSIQAKYYFRFVDPVPTGAHPPGQCMALNQDGFQCGKCENSPVPCEATGLPGYRFYFCRGGKHLETFKELVEIENRARVI